MEKVSDWMIREQDTSDIVDLYIDIFDFGDELVTNGDIKWVILNRGREIHSITNNIFGRVEFFSFTLSIMQREYFDQLPENFQDLLRSEDIEITAMAKEMYKSYYKSKLNKNAKQELQSIN